MVSRKADEMKIILITGASSGIGKACALAAAQLDYLVYAGYRKAFDREALESLHKNIRPIKIDVAKEEDRKSVVDFIKTQHEKIDCLFNNAGIAASGAAEFQSMEKFRQQMEINFLAPVALTKEFIPMLRKSSDPRILFTSSAAGLLAKPMMASYSASKFALEAYIDTIRVELDPWGIKVSAFEPGKVKTEIYKKSLEMAQQEQAKMCEEEKTLYKPLIDVAMYNIKNADSMSSEVSVVVDAFTHALTSHAPKARYAIGGDAPMQAILAKLPAKLRDWIIKKKIQKLSQKSV